MSDKSRRGFFKKLIIGGTALYVGGWWFLKVRKGDATDYIKSALKKHLGYLKLDKDGVERFASEFQERISPGRRYWGSWVGIVGPLYSTVDLLRITPRSKKFKEFEEDIVTMYLLSSDFFIYDADMSRTIQYIQFYDTFEVGCANPFAQY